MEMDSSKADTRAEMKRYEMGVQEINNKFTISLSDLRTEIESAKWDSTRRAIAVIAIIVVASVVLSTFNIGHGPVPTVDVGEEQGEEGHAEHGTDARQQDDITQRHKL